MTAPPEPRAPAAPHPGPPGAAEARLAAAGDGWRRKLLDLTKRNRALNFRPARVSTVTVVDERPAEVFRQLFLRERSMRFTPAPPRGAAGQSPEAEGDADAGDGGVDETLPEALDFVPYDRASLGERHTDEWLQTASTPDALDRSLRRLDEQARLAIEEQGVNTLFLALGMLHYAESDDAAHALRAPLVLLPVELSRRSARAGYTVRATDDDPVVNPALAELLRRTHGVALPELPEPGAMAEEYDLQTWLAAAADAVAGRAGWRVTTDVALALFSFQKLVMYKDLEANAGALAAHRLVRQLVLRGDTGHVTGLPDDVRAMELDAEYPPERTFQVVDADSTQLRAAAAAARGHDLVIEGPPGTGKSQTITNVIAQALAADKSVLFVAEKMAALSVVHARLVAAGLGEFCLELHSTKANKRAVMKALAAALDASLQPVAAPTASTQRLPEVRAALSDYVRAVHEPYGALGVSPFRGYGEYAEVRGAPRVRWDGAADGVTLDRFEQAVRDLQDLAAAAGPVGVPDRHPWRDTTRTFYSADELDAVRELAREAAARARDVAERAWAAERALGLPAVRTLADADAALAVGALLRRSPGAPRAVLESPAWDAGAPPEAARLIEAGRALGALRERVLARVTEDALAHDHAADAAYVERKSQGILSALAFLDGRWRAIARRWAGWRRPGWAPSPAEQAPVMREADRLRAERAALAAREGEGRALFGAHWRGEGSDWDALDAYARWVAELREAVARHGLSGAALDVAARPAPDVAEADRLRDAALAAEGALARLRAAVGWPADYLAAAPLDEIAGRAAALAEHAGLGPRWAAFESARRAAAGGLARELLPLAASGELPYAELAPAFRRAFWLRWLAAAVRARPALERFSTMTHEERVAEFRALDERVLRENRAALVNRLRDRVQRRLREPDAAAALQALRPQLVRARNIAPLRTTMRHAEAAVRAIKPCFMMSPLTAAQYLDGSSPTFDVVIFDEASQLPTEDAVGAVLRGRQLVVVGDPKQLPPTDFFAASLGDALGDDAPADDGPPAYEDAESVLEEFMGAGVPMSRLRWHYRSAHESLITFSNVSFYDAELFTFPSVETDTAAAGLAFVHVDGVYEGKGVNTLEARRVADEVVAFAREQLARRGRGEPALSLGVGTFNMRQQLAIQDELERRRRDDPSVEPFFDRAAPEPFFVKNLENIQGDERDVVFLGVTYARGPDGRLRHNFGPLNGENGWRRLNVLTTRARRRMVVFSSMRGDEISAAATTSHGARLLREFLLYAERGRLDGAASAGAATESPFERDVLQELTRRGVTVVPQVGVAGYRIDLGVLDASLPGRFVCGIECDGAAYHASETARDRDRLRQQVLEARGWTIHRVWSTDWFKDREGQVERLLRLVDEARARAAAPPPAAPPVTPAPAPPPSGEAPPAGAGDGLTGPPSPATPYERPEGAPYAFAPGEGRFAGDDILAAPAERVLGAVLQVVEAEAPVHAADLTGRVAAMWDTRAGSRIAARILEACAAAERAGRLRRRGEFFWGASDAAPVRARGGTGIPAERVAPEEYEAAVRLVLAGGHGLARPQLTNEVRAVLGYGRAGPALEEAIGAAVDRLLASGALGEGSSGIRLR